MAKGRDELALLQVAAAKFEEAEVMGSIVN